MEKIEAKQKIIELINAANEIIPKRIEPDLPPSEFLNGEPEWHDYENKVWKFGEEIRQILTQHKSLRRDNELIEKIVSISLKRNSKRGRQSFIMLLWYKEFGKYSEKLITQLDDKGVHGHIIEGLNKMKVHGYVDLISPYCSDRIAWIRNQAKKYVKQYRS